MNMQKKSCRGQIASIAIGESINFPIEKYRTVQSLTQEIKLIYSRSFKTQTNREAGTITVTRIA